MLENQSGQDAEFLDSSATQRLRPEDVSSLYRQHSQGLLAYLVGVLKNADQAAEALQNTFQRVLEAGHTARRESFQGWIYKVAFHEAMALRRKMAIEQRANHQYSAVQAIRQLAAGALAPQEWHLTQREELVRIQQALAQLPAEQRFVVERRVYHEETFAVIAAQLKVPIGTVLTRMRLALQKLQKSLGDLHTP